MDRTLRQSGPTRSVTPLSYRRLRLPPMRASIRDIFVAIAVRDLEGKPLQGQTHGLKDKTVGHVFRLREGKVARFDIQDAA